MRARRSRKRRVRGEVPSKVTQSTGRSRAGEFTPGRAAWPPRTKESYDARANCGSDEMRLLTMRSISR